METSGANTRGLRRATRGSHLVTDGDTAMRGVEMKTLDVKLEILWREGKSTTMTAVDWAYTVTMVRATDSIKRVKTPWVWNWVPQHEDVFFENEEDALKVRRDWLKKHPGPDVPKFWRGRGNSGKPAWHDYPPLSPEEIVEIEKEAAAAKSAEVGKEVTAPPPAAARVSAAKAKEASKTKKTSNKRVKPRAGKRAVKDATDSGTMKHDSRALLRLFEGSDDEGEAAGGASGVSCGSEEVLEWSDESDDDDDDDGGADQKDQEVEEEVVEAEDTVMEADVQDDGGNSEYESDEDEDEWFPLPEPADKITLALAFNRCAPTDIERISQLAADTKTYVMSCGHTDGGRPVGPEHIDTKFGSHRFLGSLKNHFRDVVKQDVRVEMMVLDYQWMQEGGDGQGGWVTGYLSGQQGSKAYYLLQKTVPELAKDDRGLRDVWLPVDKAGIVVDALTKSQPELVTAGMGLELIHEHELDKNPLYLASVRQDFLIKDHSVTRNGTGWHVAKYCAPKYPFVHLFNIKPRAGETDASLASMTPEQVAAETSKIWEEPLAALQAEEAARVASKKSKRKTTTASAKPKARTSTKSRTTSKARTAQKSRTNINKRKTAAARTTSRKRARA